MAPLADKPSEIGFCDFTKVKRVEITLRGEPFPHLLAACGGVPKALHTIRLHHDRLTVVGRSGAGSLRPAGAPPPHRGQQGRELTVKGSGGKGFQRCA